MLKERAREKKEKKEGKKAKAKLIGAFDWYVLLAHQYTINSCPCMNMKDT